MPHRPPNVAPLYAPLPPVVRPMAPTTPLSAMTRLTPINTISLNPILDDPMNEVGRGLGQAPVEPVDFGYSFSPVISGGLDSPKKRVKQCPGTPIKTPISSRVLRQFSDLGMMTYCSFFLLI